jgi:hypothetical protein
MRDANGRWLPGPDRDRHRQTRREQRRGYANAMDRLRRQDVHVYAWVWRKVRGYYRRRRRSA